MPHIDLKVLDKIVKGAVAIADVNTSSRVQETGLIQALLERALADVEPDILRKLLTEAGDA